MRRRGIVAPFLTERQRPRQPNYALMKRAAYAFERGRFLGKEIEAFSRWSAAHWYGSGQLERSLAAIYQRKHDLRCGLAQRINTRALLDLARAFELRFISIDYNCLLTFEDVRRDWWPVAWSVAELTPWHGGGGCTEDHGLHSRRGDFAPGLYHLGQLLSPVQRRALVASTHRPYVRLGPPISRRTVFQRSDVLGDNLTSALARLNEANIATISAEEIPS